jgi:hypothetical protein
VVDQRRALLTRGEVRQLPFEGRPPGRDERQGRHGTAEGPTRETQKRRRVDPSREREEVPAPGIEVGLEALEERGAESPGVLAEALLARRRKPARPRVPVGPGANGAGR